MHDSSPLDGSWFDSLADELDASLVRENQTLSLEGLRAFVTGCTSGIGLALTVALLREGVNVTGVGRRKERLEAIAKFATNHGLKGNFRPYCKDCTAPEFFAELKSRPELLQQEILVCNAGLARGLDPVSRAVTKDWNEMISTNLSAVFELVHTFLPEMIKAKMGTIVGLGSIAGHVPYENGSVYCATKHALRAFFSALRQETCGQNIRVNLVSPGMVKTAFSEVRFHGDRQRAEAVYAGVRALTPQDIANIIVQVLKQPIHVNIDDIVVMPVQQGSVFKVVREQ